MGRVALKLITGPANAEKAGAILDAYVAALDREPILVVPTIDDVQAYRRELAQRGVVFGAEVLRWSWLERELARRAGVRGRAVGRLTQERIAARAVEQADLAVLAESARTPGFARALAGLCEELEATRVDPARWYQALREWGRHDESRAAYAEDLGALYSAYRRGLERLERMDKTLRATAALDALRLDPARWRGSPVLLYGFDDLTALQVDTIETLALRCDAEVTVSLPHEAGRVAFAGRAQTYQDLLALGADVVELEAVAEHYVASSRDVLHHIERRLFEGPEDRVAAPEVGEELLLLRGGGERAEFELVGERVARAIADGIAPEDIAIVVRSPEAHAALIADVLGGLGVPFALRRRLPVGHTALGRALRGLIRAALLDGGADDLLAWLRAPGHVRDLRRVDDLEAAARREGARSAAAARAIWESKESNWPLDVIDRLARAAATSPAALCERLAAEADRLMRAPHRAEAAILEPSEALEVSAAAQIAAALRELARLAETDTGLIPDPHGLIELLSDIEVYAGETGPGRVTVADPLAVRARRVRALFACSLQEGSFPQPGRPDPFLGDDERRAINIASGLRLRLREDRLGAERHLFYATVSRPTELLALSWHDADDDGAPLVRSLFVDDVLDLFVTPPPVRRRELGAVGFADAPTAREAARVQALESGGAESDAIGPLRSAAVLNTLAERETWSASGIETWVACPVKWFVERMLRPEALIPDPEPMVRGELAHAVLADILGALAASGPGPLRPEQLPRARQLALEAIERHRAEHRISADPQRLEAALRRLRADVLNYLEYAAGNGSQYVPSDFELRFGGARDERGPVEIAPGVRLEGRIDRVDRSPSGDSAVVYDYKGVQGHPRERWLKDGRLQLALYMLALPELLGVEATGGLYQPLRNDDPRPRGLILHDADPALDAVSTDRADGAELVAVLEGARAQAATAVADIRAGRLTPKPETCGWKGGGCSYPSICRCAE